MKGIPLHPLRLAALDRMKVLRVPFREQPGKRVARLVKSMSDLHWIEQYVKLCADWRREHPEKGE